MTVDNNNNRPVPPRLPAPTFAPTPKGSDADHARKAALTYGTDRQLSDRVVNDTSGTEVRTEEQNREAAQVQGEMQKEGFSPSTQAHPQLVKTQAKADAKAQAKQKALAKGNKPFLKGGGKAAKPTQTAKVKGPETFQGKQTKIFRERMMGDSFHAAASSSRTAPQDPNLNMARLPVNVDGKKNGPSETKPRTGDQLARMPQLMPAVPQQDANELRRQVMASKANMAKHQPPSLLKSNPALKMFQQARTAGGKAPSTGAGPSLVATGGAQARSNSDGLSGLTAAPGGAVGQLSQDGMQAPTSNLIAFGSAKPPQGNVVGIETNSAWNGMAPSVSLDKGAVATAFNGSLIGFPSPVPQQKTA